MYEFTDEELDTLERPESWHGARETWREYKVQVEGIEELVKAHQENLKLLQEKEQEAWEVLVKEEAKLRAFRKAQNDKKQGKNNG